MIRSHTLDFIALTGAKYVNQLINMVCTIFARDINGRLKLDQNCSSFCSRSRLLIHGSINLARSLSVISSTTFLHGAASNHISTPRYLKWSSLFLNTGHLNSPTISSFSFQSPSITAVDFCKFSFAPESFIYSFNAA